MIVWVSSQSGIVTVGKAYLCSVPQEYCYGRPLNRADNSVVKKRSFQPARGGTSTISLVHCSFLEALKPP